MKRIKELVDTINEEIEGARNYAMEYIEYRANGDATTARKLHDMAEDELRHAAVIHDIAVTEIDKLRRTITPPEDMEEKWRSCHKKYIEKVAEIKVMLQL